MFQSILPNESLFESLEPNKRHYNPKQTEIKFFWPLTEQIPLDLDYTDCERPKLSVDTRFSTGTTYAFAEPTWTTNIAPTLSVQPTNSVGQLNIGGIQIGLEKKPNLLQRLLHKLLGFDWKDN